MRIHWLIGCMPRLNIYLPDDVYELASKWRNSANLSEICAQAIRDEFNAVEESRTFSRSLAKIRPPTDLEALLASRFDLHEVVISDAPNGPNDLRDAIGKAASGYIDKSICDGSLVAIAGGRQIWCAVQHLSPRRVRSTITALGMHQADPQLLHAHPNTLATLMWLLYSPRSQAHVVGAQPNPNPWLGALPTKTHPTYFVFSSCSSFVADSPFAKLLGPELVVQLLEHNVFADYAYTFFDASGKEIDIPLPGDQFRLPASLLRTLSARSDARTVLIAGGEDKFGAIRTTLTTKLCNSLITDPETGRHLLN